MQTEETIEIVGRFSCAVDFVERKPGPPEASFQIGNKVIFSKARFAGINVDKEIGRVTDRNDLLATVNAEAQIRGSRLTRNGHVGQVDFTKVEVDFGSNGQADLVFHQEKGNGPSSLFHDFVGKPQKILTNGAVPVKGLNKFAGYHGTIFFAGSLDAQTTDVIITCVLQRDSK